MILITFIEKVLVSFKKNCHCDNAGLFSFWANIWAGQPRPAKPATPAKPAQAAKQAKAARPAKPAKPAKPAEPAKPYYQFSNSKIVFRNRKLTYN